MTSVALLLAALGLLTWPCAAAVRQVGVLSRSGRLVTVQHAARRPWRPRRVRWEVCGLACAVPTAIMLGALPAMAVGAAAAAGVSAVHDVLARRRRAQREAALSRALDLMRAELEAGSRPAEAFAAAMVAAPDFATQLQIVHDAVSSGGDPCANPMGSEVLPVARAWSLAATAGVAPGPVLALVAEDRRFAHDVGRAVDSAVAGVRASGALLCLLPVFALALGAALGARPFELMVASPWARAAASVGMLLDVAGIVWLRRLTAGAQRC